MMKKLQEDFDFNKIENTDDENIKDIISYSLIKHPNTLPKFLLKYYDVTLMYPDNYIVNDEVGCIYINPIEYKKVNRGVAIVNNI